MKKWSLLRGLLLGVFLLAGCAPAHMEATPTATAAPTIFLPTATPTATLLPTQTPTADPATQRTRYELSADLDYSTHLLTVTEKVSYTNRSSQAMNALEFVVPANAQEGVFSLDEVRDVNGTVISGVQLQGVRLTIPLVQSLQSGQSANFSIFYNLALPKTKGVLSFTDRQVNLAGWYPYAAVYTDSSGWLVHDPGVVGEYEVYERADYAVSLQVQNAPENLTVAASMKASSVSGQTYTYEMEGARNFVFSLSPEYETLAGITGSTTVTVYSFAEDETAANVCLETTLQALEVFGSLYGSYPRQNLTAVEATFADGMEYDGLYFLGSEYFKAYQGQELSYLEMLSAHETAHQWAGMTAASDQALEPWLDESLATYSEELYFEKTSPDQVDAWREKRIQAYTPTGLVNSSIYDFSAFRPYVNAVYLRGAEFLDDLRNEMGDEKFFTLLKSYFAQARQAGDGPILTGADFWTLEEQISGDPMDLLRSTYFGVQLETPVEFK